MASDDLERQEVQIVGVRHAPENGMVRSLLPELDLLELHICVVCRLGNRFLEQPPLS
jgi:hypothetical protein